MKIIELKIDDSTISGFEATAFVENPAIEQDFIAFKKVELAETTFNDYPQGAIDAAQRGIDLNKKNNNKCATQVGKVRAQQLVNGEKLSLDTIMRMRSFLLRARSSYDLAISRKDYNACGYISYLLWGGEAALPWTEKKLRQAGIEFSNIYNNEGELTTYAKVGPRGGIVASPKAPKSDTKNPNPKGEGTAKGSAKSSRGAEVSADVEKTLQDKADEFNEKYKDKLGYGVTVGQLKSVFQRGLGAYNTSRSPSVASRGGAKQWAMARVNAFLYIVKTGRPQNKKYIQDNDLLPSKHPKSDKFSNDIIEDILKDYLIAELLGLDEEDFMEGVPHYTKEGKLYEGPTHKDATGRLMTGEVHTDDSVYLYHIEELLEMFGINVNALPNYINEASIGKKRNFAAELADKQMLVGPLMTPGKLIPRKDENTGEEYQVFFSKETIEKIAYKMMKDGLMDSVNIEHDGANRLDDVYLVETWLVKDPKQDKSTLYGFKPVEGEWFGIYRVGNGRVWNEYIKTDKVKGFSVEGYFVNNVLTTK